MSQKSKSVARLFFLYIPLLLLLCVVVLAATLTLKNKVGSPLNPKTEAWLHYPLPHADPSHNGYLMLMAIDTQKSDPIAAARAVQEANLRIVEDTPFSGDSRDAQFRATDEKLLNSQQLPEFSNCKPQCEPYWLEHRAQYSEYISKFAVLLTRFDALIDMPEYAEYHLPGPDTPIGNYKPSMQLDHLYRAKTFYALEDGEPAAAYQYWKRRQLFWQRVAKGSMTLFNLEVALYELRRGNELLVTMITRHPDTLNIARAETLPVLTPQINAPLKDELSRTLVHEFANNPIILQGSSLKTLAKKVVSRTPGQTKPVLTDFLLLPLMNKNKTLNKMRELREDELASLGLQLDGKPFSRYPAVAAMCQQFLPDEYLSTDNPTGSLLTCAGRFDYSPYTRRFDIFDEETRAIRKALLEPYNRDNYVLLSQNLAALQKAFNETFPKKG